MTSAVIGPIAVLLMLSGCSNGWTVESKTSPMNDLTSYSISRQSEESFEIVDIRKEKHKYRPKLVVSVLPRPTRFELRVMDGVFVNDGHSVLHYRLDDQPAATATARRSMNEVQQVTFDDPEAALRGFVQAGKVKIQWQEVMGPERVFTYEMRGLREAVKQVCEKDPSLGCDDTTNPIGRVMGAPAAPR